MSKRKRKKARRPRPSVSPTYRQNVRQADEILARNDVDLRADNWQQLALEWVLPEGPEREDLARYVAEHERKLGVAWARDLMRLEVFFQSQDHPQVIAYYERVFSRYPRCALLEAWVADLVFRHDGDFWRARRMYYYAVERLPDYPKPYYELGFMSYLLGDFPSALAWFDQAADRVGDDLELGARTFFNRGLARYLVDGDKKAAIADVQEALRRKPDYPQAREALQGLQGTVRWLPW